MATSEIPGLYAVEGEPAPLTGAAPVTPTNNEHLSEVSAQAIRNLLREHEDGVFLRSSLLADLVRARDADAFGALQQRLLIMASYPQSVVAGGVPSELHDAWFEICSPGTAMDMWCDGVLVGFGLGQLVWNHDPENPGFLKPKLYSVHPSAVEFEKWSGRWKVSTDQGWVYITPGDGQWVLYTPRSDRAPWGWGAIQSIAEWYLSSSQTANDGRRRSETMGQGIWKANLPAGARQTPDGKAFTQKLRNIGRGGVIPCPQGLTPAESYDVEILEAKSDAYQIFQWLMTTGGGKIRLTLLGQDLTSQNNTVGTNASSGTGMGILTMLIKADVRAWSACVDEQVFKPIHEYRGGERERLLIDTSAEEDREANAKAQVAVAQSVQAWKALGVVVDVEAMAATAGIPRFGADSERTATALFTLPSKEISLRPNKAMAAAARRGLELHRQGFSGEGLKPETVSRAGRIARRESLTPDHVVEMAGWFARHGEQRPARWDDYKAPGYVAWLLWGGDAGRDWSTSKAAELKAEEK